jgi:hypothetical protein
MEMETREEWKFVLPITFPGAFQNTIFVILAQPYSTMFPLQVS